MRANYHGGAHTIFKVLLDCTNQRLVNDGRAVHAKLIKTGTSGVHESNCLVNFYSKIGHLRDARNVFEAIPVKDVISWNCLINSYAKSSHLPCYGAINVLELFNRMRRENTLPNDHTFSGVFAAIASSPDLLGSHGERVGQQAHALAVKTDNTGDIFVSSSLVNLYCKLGCLRTAGKVFERMPERNEVSWSAMISGFASRRLVSQTLHFLSVMRLEENHTVVNEFVYTSVLSAIANPEFLSVGEEMHSVLIKSGLISFVSVVNALVTMYAKCSKINYAIKLFGESKNKNGITWSAMITGFAQSGDSLEAIELFSKMHRNGILPSEFTLVGFLNACSDAAAAHEGRQCHAYVVKLGHEFQIYIMTALVDMYAKCGNTVEARFGFDKLVVADVVLWTSMISGYVQNGENGDALTLFGRMKVEDVLPNELTMASLLKACSSLASLDLGKQIHGNIVKLGFGFKFPVGSALSTMYAKCGNLNDARLSFRRMPDRDVISWNAMISGFSQNGHGNEALALFEEMQLEGTKPDNVTFVNVLSACSHMGLVDAAWSYFNNMKHKYGLAPMVEHYACMVDGLSRAGRLWEAKEFIESATIDHGMCLWRILMSASRNFRNYELAAYAGEKLVELGSRESSAYVLLSSIYIALGQRQDSERVRNIMRARGVYKEPGCSWIEVRSQVHVFVVGDLLHPFIHEISEHLSTLRKHMEDEVLSLQETITERTLVY